MLTQIEESISPLTHYLIYFVYHRLASIEFDIDLVDIDANGRTFLDIILEAHLLSLIGHHHALFLILNNRGLEVCA